jgi:hypothetical protein
MAELAAATIGDHHRRQRLGLFDPGIGSESSVRALCYNPRLHNDPCKQYLAMGKHRIAMASYSRPKSVEKDGGEQWHMKIDIDDESQPVEDLPGRQAEKSEGDTDSESSFSETVIVETAAPPGKEKASGGVERDEIMGRDSLHPGRRGHLYLSPVFLSPPLWECIGDSRDGLSAVGAQAGGGEGGTRFSVQARRGWWSC